MFIYIARHAWAGHFGDPGWNDDSLRELTPDGVERFTRVVQALAERGFAPAHIATSPFVRCRQTAEIIAQQTVANPAIEELNALAPGSNFKGLLKWTRKHEGDDVCWVGHNPDVEVLTATLIGGGNIRFAKGAIAAVDIPVHLKSESGILYWHATAKSLGL